MRGRAAGALTVLLLLTTLSRADESSGYGRGAASMTTANACSDFKARTTAVNTQCCNDKTEDCSSGRPTTCDAACARVLLVGKPASSYDTPPGYETSASPYGHMPLYGGRTPYGGLAVRPAKLAGTAC